jgi:hypothetical protein
MTELPSHQDTGPDPSHSPIAPGARRRQLLVAAVVVVLGVAVVVLHLTGVVGGGAGH